MTLVYMWRVIMTSWTIENVPKDYQSRVLAELKKRNYDKNGNR